MYRLGHYGVALALYAPIGCALIAVGSGRTALLGGGVLLALTMLPDLDSKTAQLQHRGPTHSVAFALFVGCLTGLVGGLVAGPWFAGFGLLIGTLAIACHLVADVLTPMGIRPFWPVSEKHYTLDLTPASNPRANYVLFSGGVLVASGAWLLGQLLG